MVKVYGTGADPSELHRSPEAARCGNGAEMVQFSLRRSLEIEEALVQCELWMAEARQSFVCYQQFQPHRRVSVGMAARLTGLVALSGCGALSLDGVRLRTEPAALLAAGLRRHFSQSL